MKKLLAFILTLVMVASTFTMLPLSVSAGDGDTTPTLLTYSDDYAGQPAGSGSEEDPYQIATADDLLWMSKQLDAGIVYGGTTLPAEGAALNPFADKYFVQTANIDLSGKVLPSIGAVNGQSKNYANLHGSKYCVFGGNYDGQNYSISNGYIVTQDPSETEIKNTNLVVNYYATGLFGIISGATIENVTLKNIDLYTNEKLQISSAGLLVGMAVAPVATVTDTAAVNNIINCIVDKDCEMTAKCITVNGTTAARTTCWGGLIGAAYRTNIINCENNAEITVNQAMSYVGGVVGQILNGYIKNCVNNGNITISSETTAASVFKYRTFGGIIGGIPNDNDDNGTPNVTVENCANFGDITSSNALVNVFSCGGIIGTMWKVSSAATITIKNCYNLGDITTTAATDVAHTEGAIIGNIHAMTSNYTQGENGNITLDIDSVKTIPLTSLNVCEGDFFENGFTYTMLVDGTLMCTWTNLGTNTTQEENIENNVNAAVVEPNWIVSTDTAKLAKEADMVAACDLGIQAHSTDAGKYRFFATIDGLNWDEAGFNITVNNGKKSVTKEFGVTVAYNSIEENGVTVTDINGRKFIVLVLENVEADWTFEINAYVEDSTGTYTTTTWTGEFG